MVGKSMPTQELKQLFEELYHSIHAQFNLEEDIAHAEQELLEMETELRIAAKRD